MKIVRTITILSVAGGVLAAQIPNPTQRDTPAETSSSQQIPIYKITVVERSIPAINYHHRRSSTRIDLKGTQLMPRGEGEAKVESNVGSTRIDAKFDKMPLASTFGPEFLTYVLWAITPEGRAQNLGEVKIEGNKDDAKLMSTTELQAFGMIVTAEPYFAVTQPSDVVVMENFIRDDTRGTFKPMTARYELLRRGTYTLAMRPEETQRLAAKDRVPLDLQEARNAVEIARSVGADRYATDTFQKALVELQNAEGFYRSKGDKKSMQTVAREATQMAEDARIITIRKIQEERAAAERAASEAREAAATAEAERQARERAQADERARVAAAERLAAEERSRQAEADRQRFAADKAQADQARLQAEQARREAEQARLQAEAAQRQLETQQSALRERLRTQLNMILETRESARGLIVNMSDVLFDFGKSTLKPATREILAKLSGILLANPGLKLEVEGHTDSIGSEEFNQRLSEQRAASVRDYLTAQGIPSDSIVARGFGKTQPIADNSTDAGRQRNRRVEIVVSGDSIGSELTSQLDR